MRAEYKKSESENASILFRWNEDSLWNEGILAVPAFMSEVFQSDVSRSHYKDFLQQPQFEMRNFSHYESSDLGKRFPPVRNRACPQKILGHGSKLYTYMMTDEPVRTLKCVLVGDAAVGKTSLIVSYTTNGYPQHYVPTAFDNYSGKCLFDVECNPAGFQRNWSLSSFPDAFEKTLNCKKE
ncbi:hypothetical protein COOONC_07584 [Cooperia oncophora]